METTSPQRLLNAELHEAAELRAKRRRVDEPVSAEPELPLEMQIALVEGLESAQRGVEPSPSLRLVEASRAWRLAYSIWLEGRVHKIERPPPYLSIALARLFVSPRFKLISEMAWPARMAILNAYAGGWIEIDAERMALVIYRNVEGGWKMVLAKRFLERDDRHAIIKADLVRFTRSSLTARIELYEGEPIGVSAPLITPAAPAVLMPSAPAPEMLIYGRARSLMGVSVEESRHILSAYERLFFAKRGTQHGAVPPTAAMLGWRDKIVVIYVIEAAFKFDTVMTGERARVFVFYAGEEEEGETKIITTPTNSWNGTMVELMENARWLARRVLRRRPTVHSPYIRMEVEWHTGEIFEFYDSRRKNDPSEGYAIPKSASPIIALTEEFARRPEPSLRPLLDHPEWGYSGDLYIPHASSATGSSGILIMPAPWYFFFSASLGPSTGSRISLSKGLFLVLPQHATLLSIDSPHILAHQPHEFIYLPDDIAPTELADLALLQRRDIPERAEGAFGATAPKAPRVRPIDDRSVFPL